MRRAAAILLSVLVLACAAHEKAGDRAAALGDWKTAEREYAAALGGDPSSPEKRAKYQQARAQAISSSTAKAQACAVSQDWECAFAESDYALRLDPGSASLAAFRADAARNVGAQRVARAQEAAQRGDFRGAFELLASARAVTNDPGVLGAAKRVEPFVVRGATTEAYRLRDAQQFPEAIALLELGANADPSLRPAVAQVRAEYDRWLEAQYERAAAEGDVLLASRRWAEAQARYEEALRFRKGGRAETLARYARDMVAGEQGIQARDFGRAQASYEDAVRTGMDRDGAAADELERVKVRPVAIRVRSVAVKPIRPDGQPWAGQRNRGFERLLGVLATAALDGRGVNARVLEAWDALPVENRPSLLVMVDLPDGRRVATPARQAIHARLDASFVVATNAYDDRTLTFRVAHRDGPRLVELGAMSLPIAALVERGDAALADGSVVELRLDLDATRLPEGAFVGFEPVPDPTNAATAWSVPGPATRAFRIVAVDATAQALDLPTRTPADGPPDLYVEILQRGAVVYRSPILAKRAAASWSPAAAYLFVAPDEQLTIRLWDQRASGQPEAVITQAVPGRTLESGAIDAQSPRGSRVRVRLEPRQVGPGGRGSVAYR
jgi:tetratricopeptide (TPR) repeat protein